eukprot:365679-Chlamydomonas_euryale.AAC.10
MGAHTRAGELAGELAEVRARGEAAVRHGNAIDELVKAAEAAAAHARRAHAKEAEAHARVRAQLGQQRHLVEHARCTAADVHATAAASVRRLSSLLTASTASVLRLEHQLNDATEIAEMRTYEASSSKAARRAAKEQLDKVLSELRDTQAELTASQQEAQQLRTNGERLTAELHEANQRASRLEEVKAASARQVRSRVGCLFSGNASRPRQLHGSMPLPSNPQNIGWRAGMTGTHSYWAVSDTGASITEGRRQACWGMARVAGCGCGVAGISTCSFSLVDTICIGAPCFLKLCAYARMHTGSELSILCLLSRLPTV